MTRDNDHLHDRIASLEGERDALRIEVERLQSELAESIAVRNSLANGSQHIELKCVVVKTDIDATRAAKVKP